MATGKYIDPWIITWDEDKEKTYPLTNAKELDPLMERIDNAHFVLLGEASHGTHEYYTWRAAITKRLIKEKDFNIIAVEGDWPDCYRINRFIKGQELFTNSIEGLKTFDRWPTWMWANWEIAALAAWLKEHNEGLYKNKQVGFYGLDVYSLWESMEVMFDYLRANDPEAAALAKKALHCFEFAGESGRAYAQAWRSLPQSCREPVVKLLTEVTKQLPIYDQDPEASLNMEQNAHVAVNAEEYYRNMTNLDDNTWNLRDTHMVETLNRLVDYYGENAKVIVWEHNTHVGDARFTDMRKRGMINVGQLVREQRGNNDTVIVGFGSYQGTVMAGKNWGAPMQVMKMPPARSGSVEAILHEESMDNRLLIFDRYNRKERFNKELLHRAIGVVYDPAVEKYGNYVPSVLTKRYDAFIYLDETRAVHALHSETDPHKTPETYPFNY